MKVPTPPSPANWMPVLQNDKPQVCGGMGCGSGLRGTLYASHASAYQGAGAGAGASADLGECGFDAGVQEAECH